MVDNVLITGAGPTGLVLALWLTRLGIRVRIIDKTAEPGTTSRAVAVQARTLEFYRQLGIADEVVAAGVQVSNANLWVGGELAASISLATLGEGLSPYAFALTYPQDLHERLLIEKLGGLGVFVERQTELLGFEQTDKHVRATIKQPDGTIQHFDAAYLAGCDGARSTVRETLGIEFSGGSYPGVFYVADVDAAGPTADGQIHVDLEDAEFLAVFPLKGKGRLRLIGPASWDDDVAQRSMTFEDISDRAADRLKLDVQHVNWFSTYRVHHRVASAFRGGRAFLLGDAAHVHSPVGGQGMNTGIGDAVNLGWKLAAVLGQNAPATLLDTYETERIGFARRLVATTDRAFNIVAKQGRFARLVRTRIAPAMATPLTNLRRVQRLMFRTVSQTVIEYRKSPLSEGSAGAVHGGDRLPWVTLPNDADNFSPLASLDWQVHVYGDVHQRDAEVCAQLNLPCHAFAWEDRMDDVGLARSAIYLIRPDGYVALAAPAGEGDALRAYCARWHVAMPRV